MQQVGSGNPLLPMEIGGSVTDNVGARQRECVKSLSVCALHFPIIDSLVSTSAQHRSSTAAVVATSTERKTFI